MNKNKLIKILLCGLIGPVIGLGLFFGLGGMSQMGTTPMVEVVLMISFYLLCCGFAFLGYLYVFNQRAEVR